MRFLVDFFVAALIPFLPLLLMVHQARGASGELTNLDSHSLNKATQAIFGTDPKGPLCPPEPAGQPLSSYILKKPVGESTLKTDGDLRRYLECYLVEPGALTRTNEKYLPIIEAAAAEFQIPKSILTCLLFRESRFNPKAVSEVGAVGLAQLMDEAISFLSNVISMNRNPERIAVHVKNANLPISNSKSAANSQAQKDRAEAETKLENIAMAMKWDAYFERLRQKKLFNGKTPRKITRASAMRDPEVAIGASAMYLQMIIQTFRETREQTQLIPSSGFGPKGEVDVLIAAAGAYNMGPGAAARVLKRVKPQTPQNWIEALRANNPETRGHIDSISRCARSPQGIKELGGAWAPMDGDLKRDCFVEQPPLREAPGETETNPPPSKKKASVRPMSTKKKGAKK